MKTFVFIYLALIFLVGYISCQAQELTIQIPGLGGIRGSVMSSASGKTFYSFRGIPYAQPPIGDLRFKDPVPAKPWGNKHILDGTREGPICLQYESPTSPAKGQEDCLVLNVYTPNLNISVKNNLPVMVWIHGGGWIVGSGNFETDYYGPGYILNKDVVLVTINYRLGPLGFLSTEDAEAPGNYGLLDQSLALKWVYDYIHYFGGRMNQVTIFGESAGGASVEFQILSPYSTGLFQRAIAQSGSARCPWALQNTVGQYTYMLAEHLKCPTSSSQILLQCLRTKPGSDIAEFQKSIAMQFAFGMYPVSFGPRIDLERSIPFLPEHPDKLIAQKRFNAVPFITGITENEGGLFALTLTDDENLKEFQKDPIKSVLYSIGMEKKKGGYEVAQKVHKHYFTHGTKKEDLYFQYGLLSSDFGFFKCVDETARLYSKYNPRPTYYYNYGHRGQISFTKLMNVEPIDFGVCHGDELFMLFTSNLVPTITDSNDMKVSSMLIDLWTSFAVDGVPESQHIPDGWLPMEDGQTRYLNIEPKRPRMINDLMPFEPRMSFWNRLVGSPLMPEKDEL